MPKDWTCPDCGRLNDYYPYPTRCSRCGYLHTPEAVPEVITDLRAGVEEEGRLFFGSFGYMRLQKAEKGAVIRKAIPISREIYNAQREKVGLEPVTDWTKRPEVTLEQKLREQLAKPPAVEGGDLECMICHDKFDHLILGTCESCYKKWTRGKGGK